MTPPDEVSGLHRASALRTACEQELGATTFAAVYEYLRSHPEEEEEDDDDEAMRGKLRMLMGESKLRLWPLVDQLIFLEEIADVA